MDRMANKISAARRFVILVCALSYAGIGAPPLASGADVSFKRGYAESRFGQTHYHIARPAEGAGEHVPLVFFHQTPTTGLEFKPLLLNMGADRLVFAMDTPGYGGSDRPLNPPAMSDLALSMADALEDLGFGSDGNGPVDVFGFHTGVFVAVELSLLRPDLVRKIVMSGIGYFTPEGREMRFNRLPRDQEIAESGADIVNMWHRVVTRRGDSVTFDRAFEQFAAQVPSTGKGWYAYHGVWSYPIEDRFALLGQHPILILQANEVLLDNTRRAKRELLPDAEMIELLDVSGAIFDTGPEQFAEHLRAWLDAAP